MNYTLFIDHLIFWVVVAKVVDVVDILVPDQRANPDEMNPGGKAPRGLRLLVEGKLHVNRASHQVIVETLK